MKLFFPIALFLSVSAQAAETLIPKYKEETASSGLHSIYKGEWQFMVGGGVATFDCNSDGFADVYVAGGENPASLFVNTSKRGEDLKFVKTTSGAEFENVTGAYPIDVDSDGIMDLVVLRVGQNKVMKGLGSCRFSEANTTWNFEGGDAWNTAFSATWEHGNTWPSFAIGTYIDRSKELEPWGSCTDNWLLRPNASQNGFAKPLLLTPSFCTLSMLFTDWNRSGIQALRVSNDREYYEGGQEQLWKIPVGAAPSLYTEAEGWKYIRYWGMGISSADINMDGIPEYYLSSMADQHLQVLANGAAKPTYKDAPFTAGVAAHRPFAGGDTHPSTGWHTQFEDVNNDGLYDIFVAKGNVDKMPDFALKDPSNLLLQKPDGNFEEAGEKSGMLSFAQARGASLADFNLDGKLDVLIVNRHENVKIWRNVSAQLGHWLNVRLKQTGANVNAIGAWVEVKLGDKIMRREISVGGGHVSGGNGWWHFGLADNTKTQLRVQWPDGTMGAWQNVDADQFYTIAKEGDVKIWPLP
jgi:enediyne biosynthesis protein E4